jgi:hypothetical protein
MPKVTDTVVDGMPYGIDKIYLVGHCGGYIVKLLC